MTVRIIAEAESELGDAVDYYNNQSPGLGSDFAAEIYDGLARIEEYPNAWQPLGRRVRRYRLSRFPYGVVYVALPSEVIIVAIMHLHRKPDYWVDRLAKL